MRDRGACIDTLDEEASRARSTNIQYFLEYQPSGARLQNEVTAQVPSYSLELKGRGSVEVRAVQLRLNLNFNMPDDGGAHGATRRRGYGEMLPNLFPAYRPP